MDRFLPLLCFLLAAAVVSHAALPAQLYWQSVLPSTPMPSAISELLTPAPATDTLLDKKIGTSVTVGKGGVDVNAGKGKPGGGDGTAVGVGKGGVNVDAGKWKPRGSGTAVGVGKGGVSVNTGKGKPGGTNVHVTPGGVGVNVNPNKGKPPVVVNVHPGPNPFDYKYAAADTQLQDNRNYKLAAADTQLHDNRNYKLAATDTQLHDNRDVALFFLEKDLRPGATFTLRFTKIAPNGAAATFLPRSEAESIPFSSAKIENILKYFSIDQNSVEAEEMKNTLRECEEPAMDGEKKTCATSLESMVDFATSSLGTRRLRAISTTVRGDSPAQKQRYAITGNGVRRANGEDKAVACHSEAYAYAVFYCHAVGSTRAYEVSMVGEEDGARAKAVAVCHTDTAAWNPKHLAFQVLKVAPGTVPVCHFLPQDSVVWTRSG